MQTTPQPHMHDVDLKIDGQIVGSLQVMATSSQEAAQIAGEKLTLNASKSYMKISPRNNGVIIKENTMNNENTNDIEKPSITSMHEVTPLDKETQAGLENVEVGEVVPMVPQSAENGKGLRPERDYISYADSPDNEEVAIFTEQDGSTIEVNKGSLLYSQLKEQVDNRNNE